MVTHRDGGIQHSTTRPNGTDFSELLASVDKGAGAVVNVTVDAGDSVDLRNSLI